MRESTPTLVNALVFIQIKIESTRQMEELQKGGGGNPAKVPSISIEEPQGPQERRKDEETLDDGENDEMLKYESDHVPKSPSRYKYFIMLTIFSDIFSIAQPSPLSKRG